jgi:phosphatidylglycerophosphate synthase
MEASPTPPPGDWRTKPTDRFVLRWIKVHLSAPISPHLARWPWLRPGMITLASAGLGAAAGTIYALGRGWPAGCVAALAQVLDGVDGQVARLRGSASRAGAFWDSALDRYADGAMVIGTSVFLGRGEHPAPLGLLIPLGGLALIGSNLISYTSARAEALGLALGAPTLASKGTRSAVMILGAWGTLLWRHLPLLGLAYLAVHTNLEVARRLRRTRNEEQRKRREEQGARTEEKIQHA